MKTRKNSLKKLAIVMLVAGSMTACKTESKQEDHTDHSQMEHHTDHTDDMDHTYARDVEVGREVKVAMGSKNSSGVSGTILLTQEKEQVVMVASLTGLTPGEHAIHIHQNGDCSSDDGKSAGGHWNPTTTNHGKWGNDHHHMGDIGNLVANEEGGATLTFATDKWCIGCDDETKNVIGKSFIVHASADDFESQPSGAAGARVACGVIK